MQLAKGMDAEQKEVTMRELCFSLKYEHVLDRGQRMTREP